MYYWLYLALGEISIRFVLWRCCDGYLASQYASLLLMALQLGIDFAFKKAGLSIALIWWSSGEALSCQLYDSGELKKL